MNKISQSNDFYDDVKPLQPNNGPEANEAIILSEEQKNEARMKFLENFPNCVIQSFNDSDKNDRSLARIFEYDLDTVLDLQSKGGGIYCATNPTVKGKRKKDSLKHISALMLDLDVCKEKDKKPKEEIDKLKLELIKTLKTKILYPPHFIIETKNGIQPIWLFEAFKEYTSNEEANEIYKSVINGMGKLIGTKSEGDSVTRVFRLPYTNHLKTKTDPFEIQIREDNSELLPKYDFEHFIKEYGARPTIKRKEFTVGKRTMESRPKDFEGGAKVKISNLNLEEVIVQAGKEAGITIEFKEQANGTKTIIENGKATSGFISETEEYCYSMSGKPRKGKALGAVKFYLNCSRGHAYKWLAKNFNAEIPYYASNVAKDVLEVSFIAQFQKAYFLYEDGIWKEISDNEINILITNELEAQKISHNRNKINEIRKYIDDYAHHGHGKNLEKKVSMDNVKICEVAFSNKILDVEKWATREFKPADYIISKIPLPYEDRPYNCPLWLSFLNDIFEPDLDKEAKIKLIKEWFGYSLTPDTRQEKALILLGEGANGKSVLLHIWEKILGIQNYSAMDLGEITKEQYTPLLLGKLINISTEIRSENQLDSGVFKKLVSGEQTTGKTVYQKPMKFRNYARLVFATNTLPYIKEGGESIRRRLQIIHFNAKFTEATRDTNLKYKLESELSDILLWALEGLKELQSRGEFDPPQSVGKAVENYLHESDGLALFLEDNYEVTKSDSDSSVERQLLYSEYVTYCKNNGYRARSNRRIYEQLRIMGISERKSSGRRYLVGIRAIVDVLVQEEIEF